MADELNAPQRSLCVVLGANIILTVSQLVGSFFSGSLLLFSDALHNLSDVFTVIISLIANRLQNAAPTTARTFGYKRAEIVAALLNSFLLGIAAVYLGVFAVDRLSEPVVVVSNIVIWLAVLSIVVNAVSAYVLFQHSKEDLNLKSAYQHLFADVLTSVAAVIGGLCMKFYGVYWLDSVLAIGIAVYLMCIAVQMLWSVFRVLMHFSPAEIDSQQIAEYIAEHSEKIQNVHHIHLWQMTSSEIHLEAHVEFNSDVPLSEFSEIFMKIREDLHQAFQITHTNFQPEFEVDDPKSLVVQD